MVYAKPLNKILSRRADSSAKIETKYQKEMPLRSPNRLLHLTNQIPGTVSISEPEVLLPFVAGSTLTKADPREGEERSKLLRACIEVLCVTAINRKLKDGVKNISYVVIKPKVGS